jgi:hypothetical protein
MSRSPRTLVDDVAERASEFADDNRIEVAIGRPKRAHQRRCLRSALPWDGPRVALVEELGGDLPAARLDL